MLTRAKTILLTGAKGRIGTVLREGLRSRYRLVLFDRRPISETRENEVFILGDITDPRAVEEAAQGVDVILHLAAIPNEQPFREVLCPINVVGTYNVFEAARKASVPRVVFASSNHTVGGYPADTVVDDAALYRPSNMYGITKCFGELVGRYYADKTDMSVICLRIGSFREKPTEERHLATWISYRDMVHLAECAIEAENVKFEIAYGISNNSRAFWDNSRAREVLGYHPQDNAEDYAAELLEGPPEEFAARVRYHGGALMARPIPG